MKPSRREATPSTEGPPGPAGCGCWSAAAGGPTGAGEPVTAGEFRRTAGELGATEVNRAKAFSRCGMGRCQGRVCGPAAAIVLAEALQLPPERIGRLRGQGPCFMEASVREPRNPLQVFEALRGGSRCPGSANAIALELFGMKVRVSFE